MGSIDEESGEKPEKKPFIHPTVQRIWFSFLYFTTQVLSLYNTDTSAIISYLATATPFNETELYHPALPDSWSWGFSGTCELYVDSPGHTKCHYAFPPLFSIENLVEKALGGSDLHDTAGIIATWKSALATKPSDPKFSALANSDSRRKQSISLLRGGAAAVIFSLLISLANLGSSLALFAPSIEAKSERKYRCTLFGVAIFDFVLFAGALVMFFSGMIIGPGALASAGGGGESMAVQLVIGPIVALAALLCRIISIPIIAVIILCILGFELLRIVLVAYMILKCMGQLADGDRYWPGPGSYTVYSAY
ncbi:hypothetical protein DL95DRAFT_412806 [Leptodontidium sp. 2 PMI_412]|nr:hypothetical protein DL95DRAFT_412806 [Leptodontidium sp. 2 PMI_412]